MISDSWEALVTVAGGAIYYCSAILGRPGPITRKVMISPEKCPNNQWVSDFGKSTGVYIGCHCTLVLLETYKESHARRKKEGTTTLQTQSLR